MIYTMAILKCSETMGHTARFSLIWKYCKNIESYNNLTLCVNCYYEKFSFFTITNSTTILASYVDE